MDVYGQGQGTAANQLRDATKKGLAKYTMSERKQGFLLARLSKWRLS